MPKFIKQVLWLLKKIGRAGLRNTEYYIANPKEFRDLYEDLIAYARENPLTFALASLGENAKYYIANPLEAPRDLIAYARENPWKFTFTCVAIGLGIVSIVLPPVMGFAAAGPVLGSIAAGWQASIGSVAAGSAFAVIQSMAMTGAFTAIGGTLIGVGAAIPLIGGWFGSNAPGPGDSFGHLMRSFDAERIRLLTAGPDAVLKIAGIKPKPGWFLESKHSRIDAAESIREGAERRIMTTNSKETWDMVWDRMDAWRDGAVREYALERFDVRIVLVRPKKERGEEGFCEKFTDHETNCHRECLCVGDLDDL